MQKLNLKMVSKLGSKAMEISVEKIFCVGYAGRQREKVMEHVRELEAIGVAAPKRIPIIYPATGLLATTDAKIEVIGAETSGEVEFVIIPKKDKIYIGLCSDHTDRSLETVSVEKSKWCAPKPLASTVWDYEELKDHWDELILRSWAVCGDVRQVYQEGKVSGILTVENLIDEIKIIFNGLPENILIYSGTLPTQGGFVYASRFEMELEDPILNRKISHGYDVENLEINYDK